MSAGWIATGAPVEEQLAAGRTYLTYAAYVARCDEEGVEAATHWQFQASMLRRGLVLAPEDDLDNPFDLFAMACYPRARKGGGKQRVGRGGQLNFTPLGCIIDV